MAASAPKVQDIRILLVWTSVAIAVLAVFVLLIGGVALAHERMYADRMFPGTRILGVRLDGLTKSEARHALETVVDAALAKGLRFVYKGREISLDATTVSTDPDASRELIRYDLEKALEDAFALGRQGNWQNRFVTQSRLRVAPFDIAPGLILQEENILDGLRAELDADLRPPLDATFIVDAKSRPPELRIKPEQEGTELLTDAISLELTRQARSLDFRPILLQSRVVKPEITRNDLEPLRAAAEAFLRRPGLVFTSETEYFPISTSTLASWITVTGTREAWEITLDAETFTKDIKTIAAAVEQEGRNGSLVVKDGKIESFVAGTDGVEIDAGATLKDVLASWPASSTFPLVTRIKPGTLVGADPEKLGIKELLGVGKSNFSGSPMNRRKNIARGVSLVNGTIIQPGEIFSLLKTLGPVDGAHKWLPELVIKGNETKPEFGGGLCQIGTTTFRGALASGLPIVERQNHSYRVRYYEPAGTDATIYEPKPDFRFLNDTTYPVLINAYTKGDDVFFEFWGTKDGRVAEQTKPQIFNIVSPPPMKLVETLELPPGKKKCTETAHAGADAQFTYTVTYTSGEVKKETFRSHYRPWQAVCLVGVEKLSTSSTEAGL